NVGSRYTRGVPRLVHDLAPGRRRFGPDPYDSRQEGGDKAVVQNLDAFGVLKVEVRTGPDLHLNERSRRGDVGASCSPHSKDICDVLRPRDQATIGRVREVKIPAVPACLRLAAEDGGKAG